MQGVAFVACYSITSKHFKGFARRFFTLYQSGLLSYSFEPGQPIRDQISLHHAAISTAPGRKDIHIDSNIATFHIKCLSTEDFNKWMMAFRSAFDVSYGVIDHLTQTTHVESSFSLELKREGLPA
jgi:hypothetical protein